MRFFLQLLSEFRNDVARMNEATLSDLKIKLSSFLGSHIREAQELGKGLEFGHVHLDHERADVHVGKGVRTKEARDRGRCYFCVEILA
jgi:hypothetical protein